MSKYFLITLLFSLNSFASYYSTHCSNADGSLKWRSGHNDNQLIKKVNGEEESIDVNKLKITYENQVVLKEVTNNDCKISSISSYTKVWAATAIITPTEPFQQNETTFNKLIKEEVICRLHTNSMMYCP